MDFLEKVDRELAKIFFGKEERRAKRAKTSKKSETKVTKTTKKHEKTKSTKEIIRKIKKLAREGRLLEAQELVRKNLKILKPHLPLTIRSIKSQTGERKSIAKDRARKALKPGLRISESGNIYFENRRNRSDLKKGI